MDCSEDSDMDTIRITGRMHTRERMIKIKWYRIFVEFRTRLNFSNPV